MINSLDLMTMIIITIAAVVIIVVVITTSSSGVGTSKNTSSSRKGTGCYSKVGLYSQKICSVSEVTENCVMISV